MDRKRCTGHVLPPATGIVSGYLFLTTTAATDFDENDTPIANVDIRIIDKNGVTNTVTTAIHGYYLRVVPAGPAIVDVLTSDPDFPVGTVLTFNDYGNGSDPTMVTVPAGGSVTDDTGYRTPDPTTGEVIGIIFVDWNTNGVFDVTDTPLAGPTVAITDTNSFTTLMRRIPGLPDRESG